jgi:sterol desaturase/sphingolipid hydroxylase (fatty acid hydroxylase superfamily)
MEVLVQRLALVALSGVYVFLERRFPATPRPFLRRGLRADVLHLLFTEFLTNGCVLAMLAVLWFPLQALKWEASADFIAAQPAWWRAVVALVLVDFLGYWAHRAQHQVSWLWRFHKVHHSSHALDWFAGVRRHPIDDAVGKVALFVPLVWLGFDAQVLGGLGGLLGLWIGLTHTNTRWKFRRIRRWLGTPDMHHWHHAWVDEGHGHNFAVLLTLWDRAFGTFRLPDERPMLYGTADPVPDGYVGQLVAPLRETRTAWRARRASAPP